jgi:CheY-like chemotaxis protein
MQIICPACTKRLQIADDKLPPDRQVRLTCPACQERFTFAPPARQALAEALSDAVPGPAAATPAAPQAAHTAAATLSTNIDITDVGPAPRALLCLDSTTHREVCQGILPALGYNTLHVLSYQAEALAYLSQVPYECCVLDATFDGSTLQANPVLACLHALPMERRRYMFAALCLSNAITADAMTAYSHSVNLVINPSDLPSCRRILEQHLAEHKRLYRVYRELRQQLGKDI